MNQQTDKTDGGPAYPSVEFGEYGDETFTTQYSGMTLRDYFAAKATQGFLAAFSSEWSHGEIARAAYAQADSMLAERAK